MPRGVRPILALFCAALGLIVNLGSALPQESGLPKFGRDTVLVWKSQNQSVENEMVVRIASFQPDRYIEWENATTQGTVFMPARAVREGKNFINSRLFEGGVDTRGNNATTLWLSEKTFQDLKARGKVKLALDSVDCWMTLLAREQMSILVNRSPMDLPVVKVGDDRGSVRWFLDADDNPLMVKHTIRAFSQFLASITTDRSDTLRWIKGRKLTNPPQRR
jgi:hypothetical protein